MLYILLFSIGLSLASATTLNVTVAPGGALYFDPETLTAVIGDIIRFVFHSGNHTVTQSTFDTPCVPLSSGFNSDFEPVEDGSDVLPTYKLTINDPTPIYFYSQQPGACGQGMVFSINTPLDPDPLSFNSFKARANLSANEDNSSGLNLPTPSFTTIFGGPTAIVPIDRLIVVGKDGNRNFGPANIKAAVGDTVTFEFHPQNHSVIQSSYMNPCRPLEDTDGIAGFRPGFVPLRDNTTNFPTFQIRIQNARPIWGYCGQVDHCEQGMLFAINALEDREINFAGFVQRAMMMNGTTPATGTTHVHPPSQSNNGVQDLTLSYCSMYYVIHLFCLCITVSALMFM